MTVNKPLAGIRVLDMTRVLAGPFCTMILANLGAEVVKIESPEGDDARRFGPFIDHQPDKSAYFYSINCGKKSVALDLKTTTGKRILAELLQKNDKLFEGLCDVLQNAELKLDSRFRTNQLRTVHRDALQNIIQHSLKQETTDHWLKELHTKKSRAQRSTLLKTFSMTRKSQREACSCRWKEKRGSRLWAIQ
jgi:crotonobetainyl-CoA:carnitine CoA-transferase CaiB-like acyl-CoA transferase